MGQTIQLWFEVVFARDARNASCVTVFQIGPVRLET